MSDLPHPIPVPREHFDLRALSGGVGPILERELRQDRRNEGEERKGKRRRKWGERRKIRDEDSL